MQTTVLKGNQLDRAILRRIADKEADYEQMWFQDALVMENYWGKEAIQSTSHFEDPPEGNDGYDGAWMLNTVFDYHNENAFRRGPHLVPDVNRRGPIELVTKVDKGDHQTRLRWGAHVFIQEHLSFDWEHPKKRGRQPLNVAACPQSQGQQ